ncbi:MAG: GH36 C-terminal domain-containing protein [Pseudomonadota bacterium]
MGPEFNAMGVVARDQSEALFTVVKLRSSPRSLPPRFIFSHLDQTRMYRLKLIWPTKMETPSNPSVIDLGELHTEGLRASGDVLMSAGLQLPLMTAETGLIFYLEADGSA